MKIVICFALAYIFLVAGILWSIHRWRQHLNRDAIPGLDKTPCHNGTHGYEDTH
jgi:hypothetical protein